MGGSNGWNSLLRIRISLQPESRSATKGHTAAKTTSHPVTPLLVEVDVDMEQKESLAMKRRYQPQGIEPFIILNSTYRTKRSRRDARTRSAAAGRWRHARGGQQQLPLCKHYAQPVWKKQDVHEYKRESAARLQHREGYISALQNPKVVQMLKLA